MLVVKKLLVSAKDIRDTGSVPGLGRSPGGDHGNTLQYTCLENPMDREAGGLQSKAATHILRHRFILHCNPRLSNIYFLYIPSCYLVTCSREIK